ncbi:MAG: branched-chain amino acid ABC transporter permease [Burkholderiaceae bacterium]|nr:branched-chain amino acid ABC transporter permease [Burkholderiaceae bacterium]
MDYARLTAKLPYFGWSQQQQSAWRGGLKTMSRSALAIFSWAVVTGLAMGKSSLSTEQALAMSLFVFAGSAQLAALPLIGAGFSVFTILITALIVNLRFVIFSIGVQAHFSHLPAWRRAILGYFTADFGYLMYTSRFGEVQTEAERKNDSYYRTYFMYGLATGNWGIWQAGSILGILGASQIPDEWGMEFAGTLALIAVIVPMLDHRAARWAAVVAAMVAILTYSLPLKLNLTAAILAAIVVGILADRSSKAMR